MTTGTLRASRHSRRHGPFPRQGTLSVYFFLHLLPQRHSSTLRRLTKHPKIQKIWPQRAKASIFISFGSRFGIILSSNFQGGETS